MAHSAVQVSLWESSELNGYFELPEIRPGTVVIRFQQPNTVAEVLGRPNRFIVEATLNGKPLKLHLHDPGRLSELIYPGNSILVRPSKGLKTDYSVTAALKGRHWILTDSRFHNRIAALFLGGSAQPEVTVGKSRLDFLLDGMYVEVKGCSLCEGGIAKFPDAPSSRAAKHAAELTGIALKGGRAMMLVLVFSPDAESFEPNSVTDPDFTRAFYRAIDAGVMVTVLKFSTRQDCITYLGTIPVNANETL